MNIAIPLWLIIAYEAMVIIVTGAAILLYRRNNKHSEDEESDGDDSTETYYDIKVTDHFTLSGDDCTRTDWRGVVVEHLITFDEFATNWCQYYLGSCHHFTEDGFLFDEGGSMGFENTSVGFKYKEDCIRYRKWLKDYGRVQYKPEPVSEPSMITSVLNITRRMMEAQNKLETDKKIIDIIDEFYRPSMYVFVNGNTLNIGFNGLELTSLKRKDQFHERLSKFLSYDEISSILQCTNIVDQEILEKLMSDTEFSTGIYTIIEKYQFSPITNETVAEVSSMANNVLDAAINRGCINDIATYGSKVVCRFNFGE